MKIRSLAVLLSLQAGAVAHAEGGVDACRGIADPAARLACFDKAAAALSADAPAPSPQSPSTPAPAREGIPAVAPPEQTFGAEQVRRLREAEPRVEAIRSDVSSLSLDRFGKASFVLANGQVWKQLGADGERVRQPGKKRTLTVSVRRAALGSYMLKINETGQYVRVKRIN